MSVGLGYRRMLRDFPHASGHHRFRGARPQAASNSHAAPPVHTVLPAGPAAMGSPQGEALAVDKLCCSVAGALGGYDC